MLFRQLDDNEEQSFRQWARDNYVPFEPIKGIWHPVIQAECSKINAERGASFEVSTDILP
jgi:hypothetical protein